MATNSIGQEMADRFSDRIVCVSRTKAVHAAVPFFYSDRRNAFRYPSTWRKAIATLRVNLVSPLKNTIDVNLAISF